MERCLETREIAGLAGLPADDRRLRHLETCPRCRSLVHAHAEFLEPGDTSDLAGLPFADAELKRRLAETLDQEVAPVASRPRRRLWLAAAAVLAACALGLVTSDVLRVRDGGPVPAGERLRGEAAAADIVVTRAGTNLHLTWPDAPPAGTVLYIFMDESLTEIGRRLATGDLDLPAADPMSRATFCQAQAMSQGDVVARTAIVRLQPARE